MKVTTPFSHLRQPAVAGMFYPDNPEELRRMVSTWIQDDDVPSEVRVKALILPHAGYIYSGSVAGKGYRLLQAERGEIRRVILMGPSHSVAFGGLAFSGHDAYATPLGVVPVDREAIDAVRDLPQVVHLDKAHQHEHSLEVHLPFLQLTLPDFKLVPLVVGDAREVEVAEVLQRLWGGDETRIIISSDLSHYHDYETACSLDRQTAHSIQVLEPVNPEQACGAIPVDGLLHVARERHMKMRLLDLRNSGDTVGSPDRVVGYGAFAAA